MYESQWYIVQSVHVNIMDGLLSFSFVSSSISSHSYVIKGALHNLMNVLRKNKNTFKTFLI